MDTVDGMRAFVAVARKQSFTAGAKQLGISTKLASKYVAQLERKLGVQLFNRTTRRVSLTDAGSAYLERCVPLLDHFDEVESAVQERQSVLAGPIRITAPTGFGSAELVEAIAPFQVSHPKVQIELGLSDQWVNIVNEGFDLALRFGRLPDSTLMSRKLTDMRLVVFASPEYLSKHGQPEHPSALSSHACLLRTSSAYEAHWRFCIDGGEVLVPVDGTFKANSPRAVAHVAAAGLGIGMGPIYALRPFLDSGQLRLLFENYEAAALPLSAVYPRSRHLVARVRELIDHLAASFSESSG